MSFRFYDAFRATESGLLVPQSMGQSADEDRPKILGVSEDRTAELGDPSLRPGFVPQLTHDLAANPTPPQQPARPDPSGTGTRRPQSYSRVVMEVRRGGLDVDQPTHHRKRAKRDPRRRKA